MFIPLGILIAGGAGAFTGLLIAYNSAGGPNFTPQIFGDTLATLNTLSVFCAGIALGLILCFGLWLIGGSTSHKLRRTPTGPAPTTGATGQPQTR
jgi:hypothetical protein